MTGCGRAYLIVPPGCSALEVRGADPAVPAVQARTVPGWPPRWAVTCPWCARTHVHGAAAGHRVSHCGGWTPGYVLVEP